jgi:ABC-2 type transport system permease protein
MTSLTETLRPDLTLGAPSLLRLARVEGRKVFDTRAGFWLSIVTVLSALAATSVAQATASSPAMFDLLGNAGLVVSGFVPILGILLATSEWSQRTGLTTFALVPMRGRVVWAKLLAALAIGAAAAVTCLVAALIAALVGGIPINLAAVDFLQVLVLELIGTVGGLALGLALMRSPLALVVYFVVPTLLGALGNLSNGLRDVIDWLDASAGQLLGQGHVSPHGWLKIAVMCWIWIAVPMAIGLWRLQRTEFK